MTLQSLSPNTRHDPWAQLRRRVAGTLHLPGDPTYDAARTPWALAIQLHPAAVLQVRDAADVQAAVRWAVDHDRQVTAQSSGHGAADDLDGVLLLRTRAVGGIHIDLQRRTATVGAGIKAGELLAALDGTGLTFLSGSNPDPSVVGLTIGGGMSWFGRAYGLGANSIVSAEMVDGLGRLRHVTADDPDLFWAIRGGGGDFGIVTRMEIALHPAPAIYGGRLLWPLNRMRDVLHAFRTLTETAPPELTLWYHTYRFPPLPQVPQAVRGKQFASVAVAFLGERDEAEALLAPLRTIAGLALDELREVPIAELGTIGAEPTDPSPNAETSALLDHLSDATIDRLVAAVGPDSGSPVAVLQIRHLGGAFAHHDPRHGAAGHLDQPYQLFALGILAAPGVAPAIDAGLQRVRDAIRSADSGRATPNFLGASRDVDRCFTPRVRARLVAVKSDVDPFYTIRSNRPMLASLG